MVFYAYLIINMLAWRYLWAIIFFNRSKLFVRNWHKLAVIGV
jgi:hypothetical protein